MSLKIAPQDRLPSTHLNANPANHQNEAPYDFSTPPNAFIDDKLHTLLNLFSCAIIPNQDITDKKRAQLHEIASNASTKELKMSAKTFNDQLALPEEQSALLLKELQVLFKKQILDKTKQKKVLEGLQNLKREFEIKMRTFNIPKLQNEIASLENQLKEINEKLEEAELNENSLSREIKKTAKRLHAGKGNKVKLNNFMESKLLEKQRVVREIENIALGKKNTKTEIGIFKLTLSFNNNSKDFFRTVFKNRTSAMSSQLQTLEEMIKKNDQRITEVQTYFFNHLLAQKMDRDSQAMATRYKDLCEELNAHQQAL
jgi:chromosome segregation ATPase